MKKKALILKFLALIILSSSSCITASAAETLTASSDIFSSSFLTIVFRALPALLGCIALIVVICILRKVVRNASIHASSSLFSLINSLINNKSSSQNQTHNEKDFSTDTHPNDNTIKIISAIRLIDSDFMGEAFLTFANNVFIGLQRAWTARNLSSIRPFEKEELFEQHSKQLQNYINRRQINVIDNIKITTSYLHKYERDRQYEYLTVYMDVRMSNYIVDADTRNVLTGNPSTIGNTPYLLTFMRRRGVLSNGECNKTMSKSCPNCGAVLSMSNSSKCEYCGGIITQSDFDWVLSNINTVNSNTVIDNRGIVIND
ncbi:MULTISPECIES: Tim44-like domain-containing protein [unclassified Ruminococcus]|uniref:Tim44 domain-containing protein n=1 Tax=unclassified Ruminococcus TaxID=2608920 RepID=UPI00210C2D37|nr:MULTISPECIES: Tim44-like domain-containing protein [unclassified Ruminococcus]MCQ4023087.1 hypothetical protein [Ruminococcus sp. zg-924]MCQ4115524.1 hypothetical protein [Ruminococcus sp. zg-921]